MTTLACPECDTADVSTRHTCADPYRCDACGATFKTPIERERRGRTPDADDDGFPSGLSVEAKHRLRKLREGLDG
jgi:hypothetical protein